MYNVYTLTSPTLLPPTNIKWVKWKSGEGNHVSKRRGEGRKNEKTVKKRGEKNNEEKRKGEEKNRKKGKSAQIVHFLSVESGEGFQIGLGNIHPWWPPWGEGGVLFFLENNLFLVIREMFRAETPPAKKNNCPCTFRFSSQKVFEDQNCKVT